VAEATYARRVYLGLILVYARRWARSILRDALPALLGPDVYIRQELTCLRAIPVSSTNIFILECPTIHLLIAE
jgi:hypothetical protein